MRLSHLDQCLRDLSNALESAKSQVSELRKEVRTELAKPDEFAALLFRARKSFRAAQERDTKSGKRVEQVMLETYAKAVDLGFRGSPNDWRALLGVGL